MRLFVILLFLTPIITKAQAFEPLDQRLYSVKYGYYQNNVMQVQSTFTFLDDGVGINLNYQGLLKSEVSTKYSTGFTYGISYTTEGMYIGANVGSTSNELSSNNFEISLDLGANIRLGEHAAFNIGGMYSRQNGAGVSLGFGLLY